MNRLFGLMRYSKMLLVVFICSVVEICFVFGVCVFDIVQLILIKKSSVRLSPVFVPMNIVLIAVVGFSLLFSISMYAIIKFKGKRNGFKKD